MGRYYDGDIEGKFWLGVQNSTDADFFGVEGEPRFYNYYFEKKHLPKVQSCIGDCIRILGNNKKILDNFFEKNDGYTDNKLIKLATLKNSDGSKVSNVKQLNAILKWYARYELGKKIHDCIKKNGSCDFDAEL